MAFEPSGRVGGSPAGPDEARATEIASIERWRGYTASTFVLTAADGTVYESAPFRWRRADPPPDEGDARTAYDGLVERLLGDGWTLGAAGAAWCETSFERPATVIAAAEAPAEPVAAEPPAPRPPEPLPPPQPLRRVERVEPVVLVEPRAAPPPARRQWPRTILVGVASGAAGLAVGALVLGGGHDQRAAATTAKQDATAAPLPQPTTTTQPAIVAPAQQPTVPRQRAPQQPVQPRLAAAPPLDIVVRGVRGSGSWLEARRGSSTGKLLFSGVVEPGRRVLLRGRVVWARFGAAGNVAITVDGRPVALQGTYDKTFRRRR